MEILCHGNTQNTTGHRFVLFLLNILRFKQDRKNKIPKNDRKFTQAVGGWYWVLPKNTGC
jgi:hypothetical protein